MAKMHLRGVNDIPSRMSLGNGKSSRAQCANQLSRLEHQKSLLEKQLQVWVKQQVVTEHRLSIVKAQIRSAQQVLKVQKPAAAASAKRAGSVAAAIGAGVKRRQDLEFTF